MPEAIAPAPRARRALAIWAVSATLAAIVFGSLALALWLRLCEARATTNRSMVAESQTSEPARLNPPVREPGANSFASLQDSEVTGRYRFFESGNEVGTIILLPNHSMINKDGTTYRQYHWEIQPDGILTTWQRTDLLFDVMESRGVYVATKNGKEYRRIEKLPE